MPENFHEEINGFINKLQDEQVDVATRKSSEIVLNFLGQQRVQIIYITELESLQ